MAFNGGFPASYQQYYAPQYQPMYAQGTPQAPQQSSSIIWVQGEAGAKSYLVAPNTTVQLWDSETQRIFLKSADASGMPSMRILEYTIRDQSPANAPLTASTPQAMNPSDFATRSEIDALTARIDALKAQIEILTKGAAPDE